MPEIRITLSKIQTCFKGLPRTTFPFESVTLLSLKFRPALRDSLKSVPPCTLLRASFCGSKNSLLRGTTPIRGRSETEFAQKASQLNFLFRTKFWNQDGFLGQRPKSPFFFLSEKKDRNVISDVLSGLLEKEIA